jgi:hypothetical protein
MNDYLFDTDPEEIQEEISRTSSFTVYVIRFISFFMLIVLIAGTFRNFQKGADIRIVEIADHITKFQIDNVNISVSPAFASQPEGQEDYYFDVKPPINLPVEGGECFDILVEAQGYHKWENTFCPSIAEKIYIEIDLIPENLPPAPDNLYET